MYLGLYGDGIKCTPNWIREQEAETAWHDIKEN